MIVAPANKRGPLELLAQRLDHDLLGIVDPLDDQAEPLAVSLENDDVHRVVRLDQTLDAQRGAATTSSESFATRAMAACASATLPE